MLYVRALPERAKFMPLLNLGSGMVLKVVSYNVSKDRWLGNMEFVPPLLAWLFFQIVLQEKGGCIGVFGED